MVSRDEVIIFNLWLKFICPIKKVDSDLPPVSLKNGACDTDTGDKLSVGLSGPQAKLSVEYSIYHLQTDLELSFL